MILEFGYSFYIVLFGACFLGVVSGILSCFTMFRQQSLLGDVIAHASLPGICLAFLFTFTKEPLILLMGAFCSGLIGLWIISYLTKHTIIKMDTAMGVVLSVFFGIGIFLLTLIQGIPSASQAGLETYLFGSAATMLKQDVQLLGVGAILIVFIVLLIWKEFKCVLFDSQFFISMGFSYVKMELVYTFLLTLTIVLGLQFVGVVLMSALIIAPSVAARQWTDRFSVMICFSIMISLFSTIVGVFFSNQIPRLSTGPIIVVTLFFLTFLSLLFAYKHGRFIVWLKKTFFIRDVKDDLVLEQLYFLAKSHVDCEHVHDINTLRLIGKRPSLRVLLRLKKKGFVYQTSNHFWGLTKYGFNLVKQRVEV